MLRHFDEETRTRFREQGSTRDHYHWVFRRFADGSDDASYEGKWEPPGADLKNLTRRTLASRKGRTLLLAFLAATPTRSRRVVNSALKAVWTCGLDLAYPIDPKRDFGHTLPPVGQRQTPRDEVVRPWVDAVGREKDPWLQAFVLTELQYGWRPVNQTSQLKWRHIRYENHHPHHVSADGFEAGFKTHTPILAWLTPDMCAALEALRKLTGAKEDDFVFPWHDARGDPWCDYDGNVEVNHAGTDGSVRGAWEAFARKHDLVDPQGQPTLRPVDLRHWVKTTLRRMGLSDPAMAAWQGHDARALARQEGAAMRGQYDNPGMDDVLTEQSQKAPDGPVSFLRASMVHEEPGLPPEAVRIVTDVLAGKMSDLDAALALGRLRTAIVVSTPPSVGE